FHARFYEAGQGRFLSVDPELDLKKTLPTPQMWNRYAYVTNNPIVYGDPDGREHVYEPGLTKPYSQWSKELPFDKRTPTVVKSAFYAEGGLFALGALGEASGAVGTWAATHPRFLLLLMGFG